MKCIRIGFGHIAEIHQKKFDSIGVRTIGIIERSQEKCAVAKKLGLPVLTSFNEAFQLKPDFWDICCSTSSHLEVLKEIIRVDFQANIIIEKPICNLSQVAQLKRILKKFKGNIVVNENYHSSAVTNIIRKKIQEMGLRPSAVISEMSKNRKNDIAKGRFIDEESYVFGYEGSHLITNVLALGSGYFPHKVTGGFYHDLTLQEGLNHKVLYRQGVSEKRYTAINGSKVILYTSMNGNIGYYYNESYPSAYIPDYDTRARYRVLSVEDNIQKIIIVGFYEPIFNTQRNLGKIIIYNKGKIMDIVDNIYDDTMKKSLGSAIDFFNGNIHNPYSVSKALRNIEVFMLLEEARNENTLV